tara:strand:+ start:528 stop:764 length:237 start_codon:yes stop_codon:yes gene_type:complete
MRTLIKPKVKLKIASFDNSIYQVKEKSNNPKFGLNFKFYQKLLLILLTSCTFLIFPESPHDSEVLCKKYYSTDACIIW